MRIVYILLITALFSCSKPVVSVEAKVEALLRQMTLEEKIGQMNQYNGDWDATGPITKDGDKQNKIRKGLVGSMLNVTGVEHTRTLQELAMQSRLKIPLLFGQDVIHGYRTIFPIPLAEAASWDLEAIERSARAAATEVSAAGVHWTFAPMVDITRDPRWGRVMEGAGEDPYLGSLIAKARVKGFQGKLGNTDAIMACAKHFAAYGAAEGGRDYNTVDMGLPKLYNVYLPPFKAAAEAGCATFMNSFNDFNGIPAAGNNLLQNEILKKQWNFKGFVVSDWGSVGEMIPQGYAADSIQAAEYGVNAGCDMDMESRCYIHYLKKLVEQEKVKECVVDDAVKRILKMKYLLGLFDDPFKFCNEQREKEQWNNKKHLAAAREMGRKSIVLLKNEKVKGSTLLPLDINSKKKIALIGPLVKNKNDNLGFWSYYWKDDEEKIVSLWEGMSKRFPSTLLYAKGCGFDKDKSGIAEAVAVAKKADLVILSMGEYASMTGEAKSRSNIGLPDIQEELIKAIHATGKPVIVLISAGRPMVFNWVSGHIPAILYTWWLGTTAGDAIADVLVGDYNPAAKLPMSFPITEGQIPIYYAHTNTGRPALNDSARFYCSSYNDLSIYPKYCFGYGLSYTSFQYGAMQLSTTSLKAGDTLKVSLPVTNTGNFDGEEIVQLYLRDNVASLVRPVKELKSFQKVMIKKGETQTISFTLTVEDLKFYNNELKYDWEEGEFDIMVGKNAQSVETKTVGWGR